MQARRLRPLVCEISRSVLPGQSYTLYPLRKGSPARGVSQPPRHVVHVCDCALDEYLQDRTVCAVVTGDEDCLLEEETLWEVEEVDKVETATIYVVG